MGIGEKETGEKLRGTGELIELYGYWEKSDREPLKILRYL